MVLNPATQAPMHGGNGDDAAEEAEKHLVAALIMHPEMLLKCGRLMADDFFNPRHRTMFEAVRRLFDRGTPVDPVTLQAEVVALGRFEALNGSAGISAYLGIFPTGDHAPHYAEIIRDCALGRKLRCAAGTALERLSRGSDWREELGSLRSAIDSLEESASPPSQTLRAAVQTELAEIRAGKGAEYGLPTGLGIERACPTGIPRDKVTTVFGESGSFKSTVVNNLAWNIAAAGHRVLHISWEDSTKLTAQRFIASRTGLGYGHLAARQVAPEDMRKLVVEPKDLSLAGEVIMGECEANMESVIRLARFYKRTEGISAVLVDYLQIMDYDHRASRHEAISDAVKMAQKAALKEQLAFVLVSQVKADIGERDDPRPHMEDCFGSSAIRMFTKLGVSVFRPWKYCRMPPARGPYSSYNALGKAWPEGQDTFFRDVYPRIMELSLDKNVMGESPAIIHVLVDLPTGRLEPFDPRSYIGG